MADVIYFLYCIDNDIQTSLLSYFNGAFSEEVEEYYKMTDSEEIEFNADLNRLLVSKDKLIDFEEPIIFLNEYADMKWLGNIYADFEDCILIEDTEKYRKQMQNSLSETAYKMMTEYKRKPFVSPEDYERIVLKPRGFRMTDEIRRFIELYNGRVFAWHLCSIDNFNGYSIRMSDCLYIDSNNYYIDIMLGHYAGDWCILIRCDGKIYSHTRKISDNIEEFLEEKAEKYRHDMDLKERMTEIADRYFIPEIRKLYHTD